MARPLAQHDPIETLKTPDWVDAYYSPAPANSPVAVKPELTALAQMFAYYDARLTGRQPPTISPDR